MPTIGLDMPCASAGSALPTAPTDDAAIGSTKRFHRSTVPTIHSARLHAAVVCTPLGNSVVSSSHRSARRTASATWSCCFWVGEGSFSCATARRAMSVATVQFNGPSYGCIIAWIWPNSAPRSGMPAPPGPPAPEPNMATKFPLKNCPKGVPLNGLSSRSGPSSPGLLVMSPPYGLSPRLSCVDVSTEMTREVLRLVEIRDTPLDVDEVMKALDEESSGGVTVFVGRVRDHDGGQDVTGLEYSAHPSAEDR